MFNIKKIENYLAKPLINEMADIYDNNSLSFHWSNHKLSKTLVRNNICDNFSFTDADYWIDTDDTIIKISKKDILKFIVSKSSDLSDLLFEPKKVSLTSISGPYEDLELINLVTKDEIQYAYLVMLLKNKAPQRGLRLNSSEEILICFSENFLKESKIVIHQFSHTGILFKSIGDDFLEQFEGNEQFKLYIDSDKFINGNKAYSERENDSFILNKKDFKFSKQFFNNSSEHFFFVRYKDIKHNQLKNNFCNCLNLFEQSLFNNIA